MHWTSKTAQVGAAIYLCVGLTVVPLSLKAAGVKTILSPRLAAAIDIWQQVTDAFGAGYQEEASSQLAVASTDSEPSQSIDDRRSRALACVHDNAVAAGSPSATTVSASSRSSHRHRVCPKTAESQAVERSFAMADSSEIAVHAQAITAAFKKPMSLPEPDLVRFETSIDREWLNALARKIHSRNTGRERSKELVLPKNIKVLVQVKAPVASNNAPECKVKSAVASLRRFELQRASLVTDQTTAPDNSEL